ncbi:MAG TPA: aminoglycoside phosphotransferase family protein [Candidatus Limnocylindrales bacterium]
MLTPAAEVDIDEVLVAQLIRAQHPDLAGRPLTLVANGWDNAIYRLGEDLCVRMPRRKVAVELIVNEQRWLPELAANVATPIPVPLRQGVPQFGYPWPWTVTRWFTGRVAVDLPPAQRTPIAAQLGDFMAGWHVPAPAEAPRSPVRGIPLPQRDPGVRSGLASGNVPHAEALEALWDRLVATAAWPGPPVWLHGDPHPANMLIDDGGLVAVLDFGDLNAGDPATDLAAGWLVFDADAREVFRSHAAPDADTWARAHGWAIALGIAFQLHSDDNPMMAAIATHTLGQVLL